MLIRATMMAQCFKPCVVLLAVLICLQAATLQAQSSLDGFDPNANGDVRVIVVQRDGKILLGGEFTALSPNGGPTVARHHIARLNPDGTLDATFNPNANAPVYAIALQADDKILVGGSFGGPSGIGGQPRNAIARLDPATGLADSFNPDAGDGLVVSIAVQADGKVVVGGLFSNIGGQPRNNIARLDPATGLADSFNPNANSLVEAIAIQADGKVVAGGFFNGPNSIGGQMRNRIARLDPNTGLADSFDPNASSSLTTIAIQPDGKILAGGGFSGANSIGGQTRNYIARLDPMTGLADSFDPNPNSTVFAIVLQTDGNILVAGTFTNIGGASRNRIARLNPNSGIADSFNPNSNDIVFAMAPQPDGKIVVGGRFNGPNSVGGQVRNHVARLETNGGVDQTLDLDNYVWMAAVQSDGKILITGGFTDIYGVPRNRIARLNPDGTLDLGFDPNANSGVVAIAVQPDGKVLVGGFFSSIGGQQRNCIARLNATSGLADSFNPHPTNGSNPLLVKSIVIQPDGKILVGGDFSNIGGQSRKYIARLDPTTGLADSFNPAPGNKSVHTIAVQADGKVLVGGSFGTIGGQTRQHLARLDPVTGLADSLDPSPNSNNGFGVLALTVQADGKILVAGDFTTIGGEIRNYIARLDPTTGSPDSFDPSANDLVDSIAVQADEKIWATGRFTTIGGQIRNHIARLDAATGLADSFDLNANDYVGSVALQADGKILVAGNFTNIGGASRFNFARLTNDTAALQNLDVTQTTINWTRSGSSSQFTRVTFESSTDNLNYSPIGDGTATGNTWTLTGLSLPTGQNVYIRARGYYRCGGGNGSESSTESIRNAFLSEVAASPTPTPTPPSTVTISGTVNYCPNPSLGSVANVTLMLTGDLIDSTLSDSSGNYLFSSLPTGGNYTVTPSKKALAPGASGINTLDIIATQRHFLNIAPLPQGCSLTAADVNGDSLINTLDIVAMQRFFLILPTGTANVGQYQFEPDSRFYSGIGTDQVKQNYETLVFGDVVSPFVE